MLVARPWLTGRTSAAALVRKVDADAPTLLLDESDAAFGGEKEYAEALRGILNSGYRRSGKTTLCVGQGANISFRDFSTFGAKAIAGIGRLPDTVEDRALRIELKRRKKDEPVERFRERDVRGVTKPIRTALQVWATDESVARLRAARPSLPDALDDRAQDVVEPLLAIADLAAGEWPTRARDAAVVLIGQREEQDINVELLADIWTVFDESDVTFIGSTELVHRLVAIEGRPWGDWQRGKAITARAVADRLRAFGIIPASNGLVRGYQRDRFLDAWSRYPPIKVSNRQTTNETGPEIAQSNRQTDEALDALKKPVELITPGFLDTLTGCDGDTVAEDENEYF